MDELVEITTIAKLHDDIEFLSLDDTLAVADDIEVLKLFEKFDLIENVFPLLLGLPAQFDLFDDVLLTRFQVEGEVCVSEGTN